MNLTFIVILGLCAVTASVLAMMYLPHARRNHWFEVVLWFGTAVVSFLSALLAEAGASELALFHALTEFTVLGMALIPAIVGAVAGALIVNLPLWFVSRFDIRADAPEWSGEEVNEE
jgi:hypothetical protein